MSMQVAIKNSQMDNILASFAVISWFFIVFFLLQSNKIFWLNWLHNPRNKF